MIKISNVNVTINAVSDYNKSGGETPQNLNLTVSVQSDSREFLERIAQAVHRELATPEREPQLGLKGVA